VEPKVLVEPEPHVKALAAIWKRKPKKAGGRKTGEKKGGN